MRVARTIVMALGMAGLAACGGSKEPAAEQEAAQSAGSAQTPAPVQAPVQAGAAPPQSFMQCISCHSVKPGVNGVGPSLAGIVGQKAAAVPGYAFSEPLKNAGLTWDPATLDKWLAGPMQMVPGTKMVFPGMPDAAKRKELIDYLATLK